MKLGSLLLITQAVFLTLSITGAVTWPWWLVVLPALILGAMVIVGTIIAIVLACWLVR